MNGTSFGSSVSFGIVPRQWKIKGSADFNGDGKPDILWQKEATGESAIWLMNGTVKSSAVYLPRQTVQWDIVGAGDFNGDGSADILWQNSVTGIRAIWLMDGTSWCRCVSGSVSVGTATTSWEIVGAGNFGGISGLDILFPKHHDGRTCRLADGRNIQEEFCLPCHGFDRGGHWWHGRL